MQIAGSCAAAGATAAHAATAAADHLVQLAPEALAELRGMVESREDCSRSVQLALEQEACTVGGVMRQGMHGLLQVLETCKDAVCIDAAHAKGGCASGLQLGAGPHGTLLLHHAPQHTVGQSNDAKVCQQCVTSICAIPASHAERLTLGMMGVTWLDTPQSASAAET